MTDPKSEYERLLDDLGGVDDGKAAVLGPEQPDIDFLDYETAWDAADADVPAAQQLPLDLKKQGGGHPT
jgi:hypothetical protein